jgi:site-specific DNA recombinase
MLYKMLSNPVYVGIAMHKGVSYPGEHIGIIDRKTWDKVQAQFQKGSRKRAAATRAQTPALLKGIIFSPTGIAMSPTHTRKNGRLYRYYLSQTVLKQGVGECPVDRVPAAEIEKIVIDQVRLLLLSPEIIVQTWRSARKSIKGLTESGVRSSLLAFEPLWNELFPAEQSRIIELLVERVDVQTDRVDIKLRIAGVTSLLGELTGNSASGCRMTTGAQAGKAHISKDGRTAGGGQHFRKLSSARWPKTDPVTPRSGTMVASWPKRRSTIPI